AAFLVLGCASTGEDDASEDATLKVGQGHGNHAAVCTENGDGNAHCHAHVIVDSSGQAQANLTPSGYGPNDLRSAYNVTGTGSSATTIAIVDAYGYSAAESDLATYRAQFGLPPCTTANGCFKKVDQRGGKLFARDNLGWDQEAALDLDMASAMCPSCHILLVLADSPTFGNLAAAVNTAAGMGAHVISNSYGGGEAGSQAYESSYDHPGIAITVSSGDSGYGVEFPASSPHVT